MQNIEWSDLRFFLAVARAGSVAKAAEGLSVNYTTVMRRIAALESRVGTRLFDRTPSGHVMTAIAEDVFHHAVRVEEHALAFERSVHGQDQRLAGRLRLTAGDVVLNYLILPHIEAFTDRYPEIEIELNSSDRALDLDLREADVAVRSTYSEPPDHLIGVHIGRLKFTVFASKKYVRKYKDLNNPKARVLLWREEGLQPEWVTELVPRARRGMLFDSTVVMARALQLGLGFGGLASFVGSREPNLEPVLQDVFRWELGPRVNVWLLHHPDLRTTARVRVFRDFLREKLLAQRALIQGES